MPIKTWVVGEEVLAADFNDFVQEQVVATFPNIALRDTWTAPPDGAMCITTDSNQLWQRINSVWMKQGAGQQVGFAFNPGDAAMFPGATGLLSVTFTAQANHSYWIFADVQLGVSAGQGGFSLTVFIDGAASITRNGSWGIGGALAGPSVAIGGVTNPMAAGTHTIRLDGSATVGGAYYQDGYMTVVDVGIGL